MPPRSIIDTLPRETRDELDARAAAAGWGNILGLTAWLNEQGVEIGKSAVGRHVQALREEWEEVMADVRATAEMARLLVAEDPDQQAALGDAGTRLVSDSLLRVQMQLRRAGYEPEKLAPLLAQIARATADVSRVQISQRRHADAVRRQAEIDARAAAEAAAKAAGLDDATAGAIASAIKIYLPDNQRTGAGAGQ